MWQLYRAFAWESGKLIFQGTAVALIAMMILHRAGIVGPGVSFLFLLTPLFFILSNVQFARNLNWILCTPLSRSRILILHAVTNLTVLFVACICGGVAYSIFNAPELLVAASAAAPPVSLASAAARSSVLSARLSATEWGGSFGLITFLLLIVVAPIRIRTREAALLWFSEASLKDRILMMAVAGCLLFPILGLESFDSEFGIYVICVTAIAFLLTWSIADALVLPAKRRFRLHAAAALFVLTQTGIVYGIGIHQMADTNPRTAMNAALYLAPFGPSIPKDTFMSYFEKASPYEGVLLIRQLGTNFTATEKKELLAKLQKKHKELRATASARASR